jgi:hypothetical protein
MDKTLGKKSSIIYLKSKFFLYRALIYSSFLLLPVWMQKTLHLSMPFQVLIMIFYCSFIASQWFLLGKEIDHRFKIYFRVNSSIDRVVYRLFMGMFFMTIYFNIVDLFSEKWTYNIFWVTWAILGLFYSWPTRGKIIQESVTTNFHEYRYLDRFEKTILILIFVMFFVSIPELPNLFSINSLKLFFDPAERASGAFWNFMKVNYFPFKKYPVLFKLAWSIHFYFIVLSMFLLTFYAVLRFFVSRRLAILGVFALLSSWSFNKILANNFGNSLLTSYSVLWLWALLWCTKSSTYRSGLFMGLVGAWGIVIDKSNVVLFLIQLLAIHFLFLKDKTFWYKRQFFKYNLFGIFSGLMVFMLSTSTFDLNIVDNIQIVFKEFMRLFNRKAFYIVSVFGFGLMMYHYALSFKKEKTSFLNVAVEKLHQFMFALLTIIFSGLFLNLRTFSDFSVLWLLAFFSILPIELVFQKIRTLRSSRNMIYVIYILICLLDSHFEGRIKIMLRLFK